MVEPGEGVYVLGNGREARADWGDRSLVIDEPTEAGDFILSDKSEEELIEEGKYDGHIYIAFGGVFAFVGAAVTAISWLAV